MLRTLVNYSNYLETIKNPFLLSQYHNIAVFYFLSIVGLSSTQSQNESILLTTMGYFTYWERLEFWRKYSLTYNYLLYWKQLKLPSFAFGSTFLVSKFKLKTSVMEYRAEETSHIRLPLQQFFNSYRLASHTCRNWFLPKDCCHTFAMLSLIK